MKFSVSEDELIGIFLRLYKLSKQATFANSPQLKRPKHLKFLNSLTDASDELKIQKSFD